MTLQECYAAMGGDYDEALGRLRSERLIQKFVLKFLDDGSYELLCKSMEEGNWDDAFRASHTIKGVSQNLSFHDLIGSSEALTESLRGGNKSPESDELLKQVKADYQKTVEAIKAFQASL